MPGLGQTTATEWLATVAALEALPTAKGLSYQKRTPKPVGLPHLFRSKQRRHTGHIHLPTGMPSIIGTLHPDPKQRFVPE